MREKENLLNDYENDLGFIFDPTSTEINTLYKSSTPLIPDTEFFSKIKNLETVLNDDEKAKKYRNAITKAVFKVLADLALKTAGKNPDIDKRAILPVAKDSRGKDKIIGLPGGDIAAFAGFASKKSRRYAFEYARLNTVTTLQLQNNGNSLYK